jgi:hypothetical protein
MKRPEAAGTTSVSPVKLDTLMLFVFKILNGIPEFTNESVEARFVVLTVEIANTVDTLVKTELGDAYTSDDTTGVLAGGLVSSTVQTLTKL